MKPLAGVSFGNRFSAELSSTSHVKTNKPDKTKSFTPSRLGLKASHALCNFCLFEERG